MIWDKVKRLIWKEKIIHRVNHILLLTGAIFNAWEESKITQKPISKILFNWQCKDKKGGKKFIPSILKKRTELYLKGLELLRKINPNLEPITIKSFEHTLVKHLVFLRMAPKNITQNQFSFKQKWQQLQKL